MNLDELSRLVEGEAVAIRGRATLEPAGGPGDKVFPPTHSLGDNEKRERRPGAKYAFETRRRNGENVLCVLLDSVQSQANRMEGALQALWVEKKLALPVIEVDLSEAAPEVGKVTSLSAPHRIADALLRDSVVIENGRSSLFRMSAMGKSFTDASPHNAGPLFKMCPTGLIFGLWDSTGPKGGLGAKFARLLTSEIVGIGATKGVKTASRIDPACIVTDSARIYVSASPTSSGSRWTPFWQDAKPIDPEKPLAEDNARKWGGKRKGGQAECNKPQQCSACDRRGRWGCDHRLCGADGCAIAGRASTSEVCRRRSRSPRCAGGARVGCCTSGREGRLRFAFTMSSGSALE
ncbi:MAG: type I-U CRISPR-associated protein Cas7 [Bryobacterales bacterium]|nr:type I-U CRISPR-associated protein Cas7 [Bryobacterales bacterium]